MRQVQRTGLLFVVGFLEVVMLGLLGCGGTSGGGDSATRVSRIALQITTEEQTGGNTLRDAAIPSQSRVVPTDPNDLAFVSRLDIEVTGTGIPTPVRQSVTLTADQQTGASVDLDVPSGPNRRITVNAFHVNPSPPEEIRIFEGDATANLLGATVTVPITLRRVLLPEVVTPSDLANKVFTFADGAAFGVSGGVSLSFGAFTDNTGTFTLTSAGQTAIGNMTILPPAGALRRTRPAGTPRQGEASTSCDFIVATSTFPAGGGPQAEQPLLMAPCEVDALDGNLILVNAATGASSTSAPPTEELPLPPNTLRIGSPLGPVTHDQTFLVAVEFNSSDTNVVSYLLELRFNPAVIMVTGITRGAEAFDDPITNPLAFSTGMVKFAANNPTFAPVSGLVTLANITFQVVGNTGDTSALTLDFPATPGGNGVIVSDAFAPITVATILQGMVAVQ